MLATRFAAPSFLFAEPALTVGDASGRTIAKFGYGAADGEPSPVYVNFCSRLPS